MPFQVNTLEEVLAHTTKAEATIALDYFRKTIELSCLVSIAARYTSTTLARLFVSYNHDRALCRLIT
jgi:hypothetical protein